MNKMCLDQSALISQYRYVAYLSYLASFPHSILHDPAHAPLLYMPPPNAASRVVNFVETCLREAAYFEFNFNTCRYVPWTLDYSLKGFQTTHLSEAASAMSPG